RRASQPAASRRKRMRHEFHKFTRNPCHLCFRSNLVPPAVFATVLRTMSGNLDPDAALMLRVREGDRAAFEMLVEKYKQPVVNLVARVIGDFTEAEDVAQHVFVQVYKSAHRYEV